MSQSSHDRRLEARTDCDLSATIVYGEKMFPCLIRDLSTTGARIEVSESIAVPEAFDLLVPELPGVDRRFRVALRWRDGLILGGEFVLSGGET